MFGCLYLINEKQAKIWNEVLRLLGRFMNDQNSKITNFRKFFGNSRRLK